MTQLDTAVRPGDPAYDVLRLGFQAYRPHHPAAIVAARTALDVADAIRLARSEGRRVAVQATGHGVGATDEQALLVHTASMTGVRIDPVARTARVGAGARWGDVIAAAAPHGLAPLSGSTSRVGVVGYLLHGGLPLLGRRYGWAAAGVRSIEVVTADGAVSEVAAADDGLGWALRGGGGSFGVVTAITVGLIELRSVHGGSAFFAADDAPTVLRRWRDWAADLPEATSTSLAVVPFPDVPTLPPPLRGRTAVTVRVLHTGAGGGQACAPVARFATPLLSGFTDVPWTESDSIHRDPPGPAPSVAANLALRELPDAVLDAALDVVVGGPVRRVAEFRRLGGALARPTGLPLRADAEWQAGTVSILGADAAQDAALAAPRDAAFRQAAAAHSVGRLANFLFDEGRDPAAVASAYDRSDFARLRAIKGEVDPDGLILAGAPIPPVSPGR